MSEYFCSKCNNKLVIQDSDLHRRITELAKEVAWLSGAVKGQGTELDKRKIRITELEAELEQALGRMEELHRYHLDYYREKYSKWFDSDGKALREVK